MNKRPLRVLLVTALCLTGLLLSARPVAGASPAVSPPKQYYLALGDSLAYGYQQAKIQSEIPNVDATTFNTGYVDNFARMLAVVAPGIQTVNLGCPGETTTSFLHGCAFSQSQHLPLHVPYAGSQLDAAVAFLKAHAGQVSPITIDLGANDVNGLIASCGGLQGLGCVAAGFPALLKTIAANMATILGTLRALAPDARIIVMQLYNPYAVASPASSVLAAPLNNALAAVAGAFGAGVADAYTPFNVSPPAGQSICTLTLFCTALNDIHASDAGYLLIAQQFWNASGYASLRPGFMVSFPSTTAGQGEVYFGSGPGCLGLVEVATQDLHPASTQHELFVIGNDLPGTVGDNGIIPGVTYWYETVTVTGSGSQIDDNGGKCYSVTIPAS